MVDMIFIFCILSPIIIFLFFFFFQAEDGIRDLVGDWSSDVCSSDLLEVERALGTLDATHKVPRNPGLPREEHCGVPAPPPLSPFSPPDLDRRVDSPALSGRGSRPSGRTSG